MPKSRRKNPPKEGNQQLDIAVINERILKVASDIQSSIKAQDERFNRLEEGFKAMTNMLADAMSGKQQKTRIECHERNSSSRKVFHCC